MKRLSRRQFERAADFIRKGSRELERALFAYHFDAGERNEVLETLKAYQNEDGGFGRALEPDVRAPDSSAYLTECGLELLKGIACAKSEPMVTRAIAYLKASYDKTEGVWPILPEIAQEYPHAPWWSETNEHEAFENLRKTFNDFKLIPRARIVSLLHHFDAGESIPRSASLTADVLRSIIAADPDQLGGGGDALYYALSLVQNKKVEHPLKERAQEHLLEVMPRVVSLASSQWSSYCVAPLEVFPTPSDLAEGEIADAVQRHLDFVVESQTPAGHWEPTWTWFGLYPEAWEQAKREWRGVITLKNVLTLHAYERLE